MDAKEAKVLEEKCNKYGIKELQFSQPQGPSFWYSQQNTTSLGDKETTRKLPAPFCDQHFQNRQFCYSWHSGAKVSQNLQLRLWRWGLCSRWHTFWLDICKLRGPSVDWKPTKTIKVWSRWIDQSPERKRQIHPGWSIGLLWGFLDVQVSF